MDMTRAVALAVLGAGVLMVSTASILIRFAMAEGLPAISVAALRLAIAAIILLPVVLATRRDELSRLTRRDWGLAIGAGAFLAMHFASWILSLEYTSVSSSVALVTTNPIWIGLGGWLLLRERPSFCMVIAIGMALAGSAAVFLADENIATTFAPNPALGNALAVIGSLAMCGYLLIGRRLRAGMTLLAYIGVVYGVAAICLMATAALLSAPLVKIGAMAWIVVIALAVGPQLLGHSAFNWSLKFFPATVVAMAILGEPIGSTIFAWWLLGEEVGVVKLGGMVMLFVGIVIAARSDRGH
ncbi:MAG: DMT family transporter [Betaproteobacteria bacterium]|nr:DMT family transporter [Betaproteobacteria bacterium]